MTSSLDSIGPDEKKKLETYFLAHTRICQEIADLREGLNDTAKALAEELNIKPAVLKKAGNVLFKSSLEDEKESHDTVEDLLTITGNA